MSIEEKNGCRAQRRARSWRLMAAAATVLAMTLWLPLEGAAAEKNIDSCVDCHRDPKFLVTNRKLYDYYQQWKASVHTQEGLSCTDCHGGNPAKTDKEAAHGGKLGESDAASAVNFRNIPKTCGECHDSIFAGFSKSKHFEHIVAKGQEAQGPTCITCHGSMNAAVVNVNTVEKTCATCHNPELKNHPEIPQEAQDLLYQFLSIHRYYRYITVRGDSAKTKPFFKEVDGKIKALSVAWHTFDLPRIRAETKTLLDTLKAKREEVARLHKGKQPARQEKK